MAIDDKSNPAYRPADPQPPGYDREAKYEKQLEGA